MDINYKPRAFNFLYSAKSRALITGPKVYELGGLGGHHRKIFEYQPQSIRQKNSLSRAKNMVRSYGKDFVPRIPSRCFLTICLCTWHSVWCEKLSGMKTQFWKFETLIFKSALSYFHLRLRLWQEGSPTLCFSWHSQCSNPINNT